MTAHAGTVDGIAVIYLLLVGGVVTELARLALCRVGRVRAFMEWLVGPEVPEERPAARQCSHVKVVGDDGPGDLRHG